MAHRLLPLAAAVLIAAAASQPALAQTAYVPAERVIAVEDVRDIALDYGLARIESIELNSFTRRWEVEGIDVTGRDIDMEIDANTGAVVSIER
jgi:uncharacterized membrane protein YkoI